MKKDEMRYTDAIGGSNSDEQKSKLAIVILNWNGEAMLETYLPKVLEHAEGRAQVVVADNASSDHSVALLEQHFPACRLIQLEKNWGFAEGYNKALAEVKAEYYLLLNSDIETTPGWLEPLLLLMDSHPEIAACQPKIRSLNQREYFEYAGACGGFIDQLGYPFCRGRLFDTIEKDKGQYDQPCEVMWATGAALMIRAEDYWNAGGLDGRFFAHNEEIDLCWRLGIMGRKVYCEPRSCVYHVGGGTLPKNNPMKTYLNFRNNLTMLYKCLPLEDYPRVMRWRWLLDWVAALKMLIVDRHVGDFKAVWRARRDFNRWKIQFAADRAHLQSHYQGTGSTQVSSISILWQYYVKGKKTFSSLPF